MLLFFVRGGSETSANKTTEIYNNDKEHKQEHRKEHRKEHTHSDTYPSDDDPGRIGCSSLRARRIALSESS